MASGGSPGAVDAATGSKSRPSSESGVGADNMYIAKSFRLSVVDWFHVMSIYVPHMLACVSVAVVAQLYMKLQPSLQALAPAAARTPQLLVAGATAAGAHLMSHGWLYVTACMLWYLWSNYRSSPVYLVDFACFQPPESWQLTHDGIKQLLRKMNKFTPESLAFQERILAKGATGEATHFPPNSARLLASTDPDAELDVSLDAAREEASTVLFGVMEDLLAKTNTHPHNIDFLIINCSLFCPTPSLCAMVVNKFGLRPDCRSYNLSGMGCSAGLISIDLARSLLTAHPRSTAVVMSTESITQSLYTGNERAFLLQNTLFRVGGAGILLSNKMVDGFRAKYKLLQCIRVQNASQEGYNCVYRTADSIGEEGVRLSKDITSIAGRTLKDNLTMLAPHVLPIREQAKTLAVAAARMLARSVKRVAKAHGWSRVEAATPDIKPYIPDFKKGVDHFCIHAGGRAVIDGIEKNLDLLPHQTEPSRHTLYTYGNTSSSSIWYELKHIEERAHPRIRRGQRVLQLAFGSGFKTNSALWIRIK